MGVYCHMPGCLSSPTLNKGRLFFRFPNKMDKCKLWADVLGMPELIKKSLSTLKKSHYLCELHFEPKDIIGGAVRQEAVPIPYQKPQDIVTAAGPSVQTKLKSNRTNIQADCTERDAGEAATKVKRAGCTESDDDKAPTKVKKTDCTERDAVKDPTIVKKKIVYWDGMDIKSKDAREVYQKFIPIVKTEIKFEDDDDYDSAELADCSSLAAPATDRAPAGEVAEGSMPVTTVKRDKVI